MQTFLVLDGNALLHRAWHAIPPLTTVDGLVVNAAYGFTNVVEKMREKYNPDFMVVAWDLPGGTFRHEEYEEYKAQREKKADELYAQIPMIQEILLAYGIPSLSAPGFEADDIIGTISKMNEDRGDLETLIVTGDLDSLQLVSQRTKVVFFVKGLSETKIYTPEAVEERYGLKPSQLIDYKTLVGDNSDNLPGVAGIGEKTALEILQKYQTVEGAFEAIKEGEQDKCLKKLSGKETEAGQMKRLVTIVRDIELPEFSWEVAKTASPEVDQIIAVLRKYEFSNLLKRYEGKARPDLSEKQVTSVATDVARRSVPTKAEEHDSRDGQLTVQAKTDGVMMIWVAPRTADLFDPAIEELRVLEDGKEKAVMGEEVKAVTKRLLKAEEIVAFDWKKVLHFLDKNSEGVDEELIRKEVDDLLLLAYLTEAGEREWSLDLVLDRAGTKSFLKARDYYQKKLKDHGSDKLYWEIERPLIGLLFEMERVGIAVDKNYLVKLSGEFETTIDRLTRKVWQLAGREFNLNSPSQLATVFFEDLKLPTKGIKKTKTGLSTAQSELEKLRDEHEIIPLIEEYREIAKLKSTYADVLPGLIDENSRIHTTYNQAATATGRLSSTDPNLQNIPIRTELGRSIRRAFVAQEGWELVSADYSQIELRLAAALSGDEPFIRAFKEGADIHKRTAAEVWDIPEEEVTGEKRSAAKAINFSVLYGVGPRSLGKATGMSLEEAKEFLDKYFKVHFKIAQYMDAMKLAAKTDGFVTTLFGRRRYLPDINSGLPQLVAAAERMAINMPIQGTQADIIKKAMILLRIWLRQNGFKTRILLQVHDELVLEVPAEEKQQIFERLPIIMAEVADLAVPLTVDVASGKSWADIK